MDSSNLDPLTEMGRYMKPVDRSNALFPPFVESETIELDIATPRSHQYSKEPKALTVERNIKQNKKAHHTSGFTEDTLVVRRGQEFDIEIGFNTDMDKKDIPIFVKLEMGLNANEFKGTKVILSSILGWESDWNMWVKPFSGKKVPVGITSPPNCLVGKFELTVGVLSANKHVRWDHSTYVYILFNPWLEEDTVYMPVEAELEEYVLNQSGQIYNGTADNPTAIPWNFGQFQEGILATCLGILDDSKIAITNRGNAIVIVRMGSALINSQDDNGVVVGNWSGKYKDGTPPLSWIGSPDILLTYHKNKHPIRYGQCWVYAGVFNTFLRCLGIPARVITNYRSAHDNDANLKTDIILTKDWKFDKERTNDSLWNYHCWNECYIKRIDLPTGLGGWQVVDSTPQETSDGMYRCGPASVEAIKHGLICYPFDSRFVFAEVNSDIVFHAPGPTGKLEIINVDSTSVGWKVLTKAVGIKEHRDITNTYKFTEVGKLGATVLGEVPRSRVQKEGRGKNFNTCPNVSFLRWHVAAKPLQLTWSDWSGPHTGTVESEMTVKNAAQYGSKRTGPFARQYEMKMKVDVLPSNTGFDVTLYLANESRSTLIVDLYISGNVVYYTGVHSTQFMFQTLEGTVDAHRTEMVSVQVEAHEYQTKLVDQAMLQFIIVGNVRETNRALIVTKLVKLEGPKLTIRVNKNQFVNQQMIIQVEFTNTLNEPLENVYVRLEIAGAYVFLPKIYSVIAPYATVTWVETYIPTTAMNTTVIASLFTSQLQTVYAEEDVVIWGSHRGSF